MPILLHREEMSIGSDANGPRSMTVYTFTIPRGSVRGTPGSSSNFEDGDGPATQLPYIIWRCNETGHIRFRWARRHLGKPEMRMGISTHGAAETVLACVQACLLNHLEREGTRDT